MKAAPILAAADYDTGSPAEDAATQALMRRLVHSEALQRACPIPFDEGRLWKGEDSDDLKAQLQVGAARGGGGGWGAVAVEREGCC